jgi:hypothetical protein
MPDIKKRRITNKDWDKVGEKVKLTLDERRRDKFRLMHEAIWREVDRQINMQPMRRYNKGKEIDQEWRSVLELGELAKASEIITADVMRLTFPATRTWFEGHSEIFHGLNPETGRRDVDEAVQTFTDKALRALMVQQHLDFGLKARYELSVKEALHHGSYVAEIVFEKRPLISGSKITVTGAPTWTPYSMWNSYPDPSPSVIGTDMFYTGSMILIDYIPLYQLKEIAKGEGWIIENINKIPKRKNTNKDVETDDIELIKYYGDLEIIRDDGNILLPNMKALVANDLIVFQEQNELPFPSVIYSGYERLDVRDPYYTSPLIKISPMQKLASQLANKYVDNIWMRIEPPIVYDANDPQFVLDGGPRVAPGAKVGTKGQASFQEIKIGDPDQALSGLQFFISQMNEGLGINAVRAGAGDDVSDKTATEIQTTDAKAEIRTAEFVDKQERNALRPFLYMQHELNKKHMKFYQFYNPEIDAPDFMAVKKQDLPENVQFEIVGSKGVLGEQARSKRMGEVTAFLFQHPQTEKIPKPLEIAKQLYQDGGVKNPERFINIEEQGNPEVEQVKQEAQAAIQELEQKNVELEKELAITKAVNEAKISEATTKAEIQGDVIEFKAKKEAELAEFKAEVNAGVQANKAELDNIKLNKKDSTVNIFDSKTAQPLEAISNAILEMTKSISENNETIKKSNDAIKESAQAAAKTRKITLQRDREGRPVGATSTIQ